MNIKTEYNIWCMEYVAWDDDNYEPGLPIGYGKTEQEAINDFKQNNMSEKTLGEARIRTSFNVNSSSLVDDIKQRSADLIDICEYNKAIANKVHENNSEIGRLWSLAQTAYEEAAMWAVKAATI